jgi:hypothetical protein
MRFIPGAWLTGTAAPWQSIFVLSLHCYALVGLFILAILIFGQGVNSSTPTRDEELQDDTIDTRVRPRRLATSEALVHESHE